MLWAVLFLLNLAWICLFAFCRLHLRLAYNCHVMVRWWRRRRSRRRGSARRGKRPGGNGGGRLSPEFNLVVEVWPRCHLTWSRGTYTRTVIDILDGRPVNVLYWVHRRSCLLCRREAEPKIDGVMPGRRFGNNLIRYAVDLRVEEKQTYGSVVNIIRPFTTGASRQPTYPSPSTRGINLLANRSRVLHLDETGMPWRARTSGSGSRSQGKQSCTRSTGTGAQRP